MQINKKYFPIISLVLSLVPIAIIACGVFEFNGKPFTVEDTYNIINICFVLFLYTPCILRNFIKDNSISLVNVLIHLMNICCLCILVSLFMDDASAKTVTKLFSGLFPTVTPEAILIIAICLSWLGLPAVAGYAWIIAAAIMVITLLNNADALGNMGALLILPIFFSVIIQLSVNNFGIDDLKDITNQFCAISKHSNRIKGDIYAAGSATKSAASSVINKLK